MKKPLIALCMAGVLAVMTSCGTARNAASTLGALDGEWKITTIDGQALTQKAGEKEAFIGFSVKDNRLYGCTGCNNLVGC